MRYYVLHTLGCKANLFDSQLIEAELQKKGWTPFRNGLRNSLNEVQVDICLVNSCTVTDEADRQTRKIAARLHRAHPSAMIVVTGCAAEIDPERLAESKGISYLIGNRDKPRLVEMILKKWEERTAAPAQDSQELLDASLKGYTEMASRHPLDREWPGVSVEAPPFDPGSTKTRAFMKIQEGCNSFCTYCVIPYGRGPARSLDADRVLANIRTMEATGFQEIIITGTNIGDYGSDFPEDGQDRSLESLLERILRETRRARIRIGSLDPTEITPRLLKLLRSEERLCPHFHVSLQSASEPVLKLMKRRYGLAEVRTALEAIASLAAPVGGAFVGMDVITGFPGETAERFEAGLAALKDLPWSRLHIFPYSERAGTPATRLPGVVPQQERVERARRLSELSLNRLEAHGKAVLEQCRQEQIPLSKILVESRCRPPANRKSDEQIWASGYSNNYLRTYFPVGGISSRNQLVSVIPEELQVDRAAGEVKFIGKLVEDNTFRYY
ncbi:MAG: tRNA (N(6)-L-threonylcarbamoyladenosine(37)-C(2))-methylthiotransferase MtaB [Bdellovibrionales bacterium GWB1_52_6]|nr:MAG: tRNA (N(6)-L-threonylcarbamoyladenosine(37)-C(2))-methylthiotransferase MtaB [Bdellovibrionales bacterium GWB1_52_6]